MTDGPRRARRRAGDGGDRPVAGAQGRARGRRRWRARHGCRAASMRRSRSLTWPPSTRRSADELEAASSSALSRDRLILGAGGRRVRAGVRGVLRGRRTRSASTRASPRSSSRCGPAASARATRSSPRPTRSSPPRWPSRTPARRPVLVDVDPRHLHARPRRWSSAAITTRTKAIVPVHLYGQPADMDALIAIADATGSSCRGRLPGARRALPRPARRLARARRRVQLLPRRRTSARTATAASVVTRRRALRRARAHCCATTASARSTSTSSCRLQPPPRHAPGGDAAGQAAPPRRVEHGRAAATPSCYGALLAERRT